MSFADVLIVGGGHGGAQAALALRQRGFEGRITIATREAFPPYERPPLSKDYLAGERPFEKILIRPESFWAERKIEIRTRTAVVAIDPQARSAELGDGSTLDYHTLIWAAGGDPRRLPCDGADLDGVHSIRTRGDVDRIRAQLGGGVKHVAVIGGGYIGLEAAAVFRKLGLPVTVIEREDRVLSRVAGPDLSGFYEAEHQRQGVELLLGHNVECLLGDDQGEKLGGICRVDLIGRDAEGKRVESLGREEAAAPAIGAVLRTRVGVVIVLDQPVGRRHGPERVHALGNVAPEAERIAAAGEHGPKADDGNVCRALSCLAHFSPSFLPIRTGQACSRKPIAEYPRPLSGGPASA